MDNGVHDAERLKELQALPLDRKIMITQTRIIEWYQHYKGQVVISFSGGKDSSVLLHIARQIYPEIRAVFSNTGLEYPEVQRHVRQMDNVDIIVPEMRFDKVITEYGYPLISKEVAEAIYYSRRIVGGKETNYRRAKMQDQMGEKSQFNHSKWMPLLKLPIPITHYCCAKMKKHPIHKWQRKNKLFPIIGTLAEESRLRTSAWIKTGCNAFDVYSPQSKPMSFWTEHDVLEYIVQNGVKIPSVYGEIVGVDDDGNECNPIDLCGNTMPRLKCTGCKRTGCIYCGFGLHLDGEVSRFQSLAKTHPRQYEYSIGGGEWADNPNYDPTAPKMDGDWENWNPKKIWIPTKQGLGLGKVFDMVNEIYGKGFLKYE